jgi:hypothetical protein
VRTDTRAVGAEARATELFLKGKTNEQIDELSKVAPIERLRKFLFYQEKNREDTTNDEVHSWSVIAVGPTFFCASSNARAKEKKMNEALTIKGDGAQRNPDIHWPKGQHPEGADLHAHNEIMVNASCETVRWFVPSFWRELIDSKGLRVTWSNDLDLGDSPELLRELAHQGLWLEQEPLVVDSRIVSALEAML